MLDTPSLSAKTTSDDSASGSSNVPTSNPRCTLAGASLCFSTPHDCGVLLPRNRWRKLSGMAGSDNPERIVGDPEAIHFDGLSPTRGSARREANSLETAFWEAAPALSPRVTDSRREQPIAPAIQQRGPAERLF